MAFPNPQQLSDYIDPVAARYGLTVEGIKTTPAGKKSQVIVFLDADERPGSDTLGRVSEELGTIFDSAEERGELSFGAGYTLEVSTPGVDSPLTAPRHYRRNRSRLAQIRFHADSRPAGATDGLWRIGAVEPAENDADAQVVLVASARTGGNAAHSAPRSAAGTLIIVRLAEIAAAVVEIEFTAPPAGELAASELSFADASTQLG